MAGLAFTISLADAVSAPAKRMQASLLGTRDKMLATQAATLAASKALIAENQSAHNLEKSITSLEKAMEKSAATGNVNVYQKQRKDLDMLRATLGQMNTSGLRHAEVLRAQSNAAGASAKSLTEQAAAAGGDAEAMGMLAEGAAAVGVAALAAAAGLAKLVIAGAEFTVSAVQSKQAAQQMFRAMAGGKDAGDQLFAMMEDLATQLPQTKDELTAWSKEFTSMGILKQDALRTELRATASAAALMGDEGSEAFTTLTRKITESAATTGKLKLADKQLASLAKTGANVGDVAAAMGVSTKTLSEQLKKGTANASAFGDALSKALIKKGVEPLNTLSGAMKSLSAKFSEAIGDMFEDVDISPFVDQMKGLLDVFSQAEPSGQAMKAGIGGFFKSFFEWTAKAVLVTKHMFLQLIIWGLKAYIALKPYTPLLKEIVKGALILAAITAGVLVVALGLLVGALALILAPVILVTALLYEAYEAWESWGGLSGIVSAVVASVSSTISGWITRLEGFGVKIGAWAVTAAGDLIDGLVNGIKNRAGEVVDAIKRIAHGAITSFEKVLGIDSPSKAFFKRGGFIGQGLVLGVRAENDNAAEATAGLAQAAVQGAARGAGGGASAAPNVAPPAAKSAPAAGGGGVTVQVMPGAITITGASGDAAELTEHAISLMFEKIALAQAAA